MGFYFSSSHPALWTSVLVSEHTFKPEFPVATHRSVNREDGRETSNHMCRGAVSFYLLAKEGELFSSAMEVWAKQFRSLNSFKLSF